MGRSKYLCATVIYMLVCRDLPSLHHSHVPSAGLAYRRHAVNIYGMKELTLGWGLLNNTNVLSNCSLGEKSEIKEPQACCPWGAPGRIHSVSFPASRGARVPRLMALSPSSNQ